MPAFSLDEARPVLERTPAALRAILTDLPPLWLHGRDAPDHWSPAEVLVHLIEGEKTLWIPRLCVILSGDPGAQFPVFVRDAQFERAGTVPLPQLLDEFAALRADSLRELRAIAPGAAELALTARHPEFGPVTAAQLLATWTAHDLAHLTQITRTMARQYTEAVGPWQQYLSVLRR